MSLLPNRFQEDPLPSLGKLVARAIAPVRDPIKEFETFRMNYVSDGLYDVCVDEKDCQQFKSKGAAQGDAMVGLKLRAAELDAFENWLMEVLPSGDVESVQSQWLESFAYADFCDGIAPKEEVAGGWIPHKPGDPCPIPNVAAGKYEVRRQCGDAHIFDNIHAAECMGWENRNQFAFIAYRVLP